MLPEKFFGGDKLCLADFIICGALFIGVCPKSLTPFPASLSKSFGKVMKYIKIVSSSATFDGKSDKKKAYFTISTNQIKDVFNSNKTKVDFSNVTKSVKVEKKVEFVEVPRRSRPPLKRVENPIPGEKNILITSALPYVNNIPHLGNIIGCVLSADVYARYCRQRGYNTLYVCGTDEYGTATETKAKEEHLTPREICNKYHDIHEDIYKWFDISFDYFGRTSCDDPKTNKEWPQTVIAQSIFLELYNNNYLIEESIDQIFCTDCGTFLADRFIEGTCPHCGYVDARGDQCDNCTTLLNATEIINPKCKTDKSHHVEIRKSDHLFLDLPNLSGELKEWFNKSSEEGKWSSNAKSITKGWIKEGVEGSGLQKRCITRDLKWGTPVPLEKYKDKVFYVWFDAPIGYLSITANYTKDWEKWWKNPDNVKLVQFMGKDNCPFHTVIFPSTLIGTRDKWTLVNTISCTEYLNYENDKFSKSRGKGVFGNQAKDTKISSEVWRYYLLSARPEQSDSMFLWDDFADKNNNELLNNLGNFVNRTLLFAYNKMNKQVPKCHELGEREKILINNVNEQLKNYITSLEECQLRNGLKIFMNISRLGNGYIQESEPWSIIKSNKELAETVIHVACELIGLISALAEPYIPGFTDKVCYQLNIDHFNIPDTFEIDKIPNNHSLPNSPTPIFRAMTVEEINEFKKKFGSK